MTKPCFQLGSVTRETLEHGMIINILLPSRSELISISFCAVTYQMFLTHATNEGSLVFPEFNTLITALL